MLTFSIIIPAYNCEKTLETTVDSVRASGLYDYEILLIDDGSRDNTPALCDRLCEAYPEVRCIHQQNAGVSAARNRGMAEAAGEYLWFVDADDTVDADSLKNAAVIATTQKPDLLIFGMEFDYYFHGSCYRKETLVPPCRGMLSLAALTEQFRTFYETNALSSACTKLFRRALLTEKEIRFREDMMLMEDFFFVLETLPHCSSIYCLPEAIYRYRQGENERGAYHRLQRISDLAEYLAPFEGALGAISPDAAAIFPGFYRMLLGQKLYYASLSEVKAGLQTHQKGQYAAFYPKTGAEKLFLRNQKSRLRHWLALRYKWLCSRVWKKWQKRTRKGR